MALKEQRAAAIKAAQVIADRAKAAGRNLTVEENSKIEARLAEVQSLDGKLAEQKRGTELLARLDGPPRDGFGSTAAARFALGTSAGRKSVAAAVARDMRQSAPWGMKEAPAPGVSVVPTVVDEAVHVEGRRPISLLEVVPTMAHESPSYSFLAQRGRELGADVVAPGELKPTSSLSMERVDQTLKVVATVSDAVDRYALSDAASLERFVAAELAYGVNSRVEALLLDGDGDMPGILGADGIGAVSGEQDVARMVRAAVTQLETQGYEAGAVVLSPADWEAAELAVSEGSGEYRRASAPVDAAKRTLWGVPVVVSTALPEDTALVLDTGSVALDTDARGLAVEWSAGVGDDFSRNAMRCRVEGRFGVSVFQPSGVVKVDLSGGSAG